MTKTILGIFTAKDDAQDALYHLEKAGYNPKDISIIMKDSIQTQKFVDNTGTNVAQNAATGATTGGVIGAFAGLLIATGVIPGLGVLLIGGPLATILGLTGAAATTISGAATGALAGGLIGVLASMGIPKEEAEVYEERIKEGGILIAVPTYSQEVEEVMDILEQNGADQIRAINVDEPYEHPEYIPSSYDKSPYMGMKGGTVKRKTGRRKK